MQDINPRGLLTYLLSQLSRAPSIGGLPIRDRGFFHVILCGRSFRGTWVLLIKNRRATTLKLVEPIFDGRHRRRTVTVHSIQSLFDFISRFPFQKQVSNHRSILLFFHFFKIRGPTRFYTESKQNHKFTSTEILR